MWAWVLFVSVFFVLWFAMVFLAMWLVGLLAEQDAHRAKISKDYARQLKALSEELDTRNKKDVG